jgi:hypothetical protein
VVADEAIPGDEESKGLPVPESVKAFINDPKA